MGADGLETMLLPFAEVLLLLLIVAAVGGVLGKVTVAYIRRRQQDAHRKVSASRRDASTAHNLFTKKEDRARSSGSGRRSSRRSKSEPSLKADLFGRDRPED